MPRYRGSSQACRHSSTPVWRAARRASWTSSRTGPTTSCGSSSSREPERRRPRMSASRMGESSPASQPRSSSNDVRHLVDDVVEEAKRAAQPPHADAGRVDRLGRGVVAQPDVAEEDRRALRAQVGHDQGRPPLGLDARRLAQDVGDLAGDRRRACAVEQPGHPVEVGLVAGRAQLHLDLAPHDRVRVGADGRARDPVVGDLDQQLTVRVEDVGRMPGGPDRRHRTHGVVPDDARDAATQRRGQGAGGGLALHLGPRVPGGDLQVPAGVRAALAVAQGHAEQPKRRSVGVVVGRRQLVLGGLHAAAVGCHRGKVRHHPVVIDVEGHLTFVVVLDAHVRPPVQPRLTTSPGDTTVHAGRPARAVGRALDAVEAARVERRPRPSGVGGDVRPARPDRDRDVPLVRVARPTPTGTRKVGPSPGATLDPPSLLHAAFPSELVGLPKSPPSAMPL